MAKSIVILALAALMLIFISAIGILLFVIPPILIVTMIHLQLENAKKWNALAQELGYAHHSVATMWGYKPIGPMTGRHGEFAVELRSFSRGFGKYRYTLTTVELSFHSSLGLGLNVRSEGLGVQVDKLLGMKDILVGDKRFDSTFFIRGVDEQAVLKLLTPQLRQGLLELRELGASVTLNDHGVCLEYLGMITDASVVEKSLTLQAALARVVTLANADRGVTDDSISEKFDAPSFEWQAK